MSRGTSAKMGSDPEVSLWIGFAPIGRALYCVVFTQQDEVHRIISLRKATPREVREYARHI